MKRLFSLLLCAIVLFTCCVFQTGAVDEENFVPYVIDFSLSSPVYENVGVSSEPRVSGLIFSYYIDLTATGTTLRIRAETLCNAEVVKSGFKNFVLQRKKADKTIWTDYYDYGDLFSNSYAASVNTTLEVSSGYQYRVTCKHYAKKSLLVTETISNTSNIITV